MRHGFLAALFLLLLSIGLRGQPAIPAQPPNAEPVSLAFGEFFDPNPSELKPSAKLLSLHGRRVRLIGFMARLEAAPRGAFYLCPTPVQGDESGGGTADLPVSAVRVIVRSARDRPVPFVPGRLEVTGTLEVGSQAEPDGTVSSLRLRLDPPVVTAPKKSTRYRHASHAGGASPTPRKQ